MGIVSSLIAGTIGTAALLGAGGTVVGTGLAAGKKKARSAKEEKLAMEGEGIKAAEFAAGAPDRASKAAQAEKDKQRRIKNLAGGKTILSSGDAGTSGKTLLGS